MHKVTQPKLQELLERVIERNEEDFNRLIAKAHDNDDLDGKPVAFLYRMLPNIEDGIGVRPPFQEISYKPAEFQLGEK